MRIATRHLMRLLLLPVLAVFSFSAAAQDVQQDQAQVQAKAQQLQSELIEIQRQALDENPELRDQGEALENLITEIMVANGANPEEDTQRLIELQRKAQEPGVDDTQRQDMAMEFQQIQQNLIMARERAAADEKVQAEQLEFQTAMLEAMQRQDPRTEQLLAEMRDIQLQQQRQIQQHIEDLQQQQAQ